MNWRNGLVNSGLAIGSLVVTLLAMEAVLRFFPVDWKAPVLPPTADDPIQRYVPNVPFVSSMGWTFDFIVRGRTNRQGWLADYDYDAAAATPLVAVVGDSFMEGWGVPFWQSVTGRLQTALRGRERVYVFAQSGAPLSQYVAYARHACAVYHPDRLVVSVVDNDFDETLYARRANNGFFHLHPRQDGGFDLALTPAPPLSAIRQLARHSALAMYLLRNLGLNGVILRAGLNPDLLPSRVGSRAPEARSERLREDMQVIDWFVDALPAAACLPPGRIVLMIDAQRPQIYGDDAVIVAAQGNLFGLRRIALMNAARAKGYVVVDMQPRFRAAFMADGQRFEFPADRHWNAHGHAIAAEAIYEALSGQQPELAHARDVQ
jgi:hypothetical protein